MSLPLTNTDVLTVAQYSARVVRALRTVGGGVVEGEVQRPRPTPGGMLCFDLTDGTAKLACKVFRSQVASLEHQPRHGDLVQVCIDRPDLWLQAGKLDVIVSDIRLAGEGELLRRREELLGRLTAEGLCDTDRRKPLPRFPRAVGVIAGRESDGMRDVVKALQDRFPPVHIVTCGAVVQGLRAPLDIIDAFARLDAHPLVDVIVIARGGGSVQDLVAFDDERLCRAVFACSTPVIAAIGHTDNVPVCNHVAWAAETPSRSPELAVPSAAQLRQELRLAASRLAPVRQKLRVLRDGVDALQVDAARTLQSRRTEVSQLAANLERAEHGFFAAREAGVAQARAALAGVPGRVPDSSNVVALAGQLDARAVVFFAERERQVRDAASLTAAVNAALVELGHAVREVAQSLRQVTSSLDARADAVDRLQLTQAVVVAALDRRRADADEHGRRVAASIRKELADHLRDYGRALPRRSALIRDAASRLVARERERVHAAGNRTDEAARRRLADARLALQNMSALLAASDPRRRGWVLPTDRDGAVVRSVRTLDVGDRLTLSFHDGAAGAVIDDITTQEDS